MQQRQFDFDDPARSELDQIAEQASLPPPPALPVDRPSLVRPDRQFTYGGAAPEEWPPPDQDRDTIAVDRLREDIDGPPHRFVIRRGDIVEVYLSLDRAEIGEVTGISHRNNEVRVSLQERSEGLWFSTEQIYPTVETGPQSRQQRTRSHVAARASEKVVEGVSQSDNVRTSAVDPPPQYTLEEFREFRRRYDAGQVSLEEYHASFERLLAAKESFQADLIKWSNAKQLAALATRLGCHGANQNTKSQNANSIFRQLLLSYVVDGTVSYSMTTGFEEAVVAKVRATTVRDLMDANWQRQIEKENRDKSLRDPESFLEFRTFLLARSEAELSDEQLARYDRLHAASTRERRAAATAKNVTRFESEELQGYEFQLKAGFHDRRQCPVWIAKLASRVERESFNELNRKAKMLGGWYSSFKKDDAGFQFLEREAAERFVALASGDADRTDVLRGRKDRKEQSAAERLHKIADDLTARAGEAIDRSNESLQNTSRRADIQAGVRGRAHADAALARTMHSIAEALSRGESTFLDGIRHKSQVETLDIVLRVALFARLRHDPHPNADSGCQPNLLDVCYASYPYPTIYRNHLARAIAHGEHARGMKQTAARMAKRLRQDNAEYMTFRHEQDVELLEEFVSKLKRTGYDSEVFGWALEKYQRLQRANITDIHELRAALREYLDHRAEARGDDSVKVAERELIGQELPGFFPTPRAIIARMLELAEIEPQHRVLEPSCGKGDILDAIQADHPTAALHAIELNRSLADILSAKGHSVEFGDFLEHRGRYDRIVMNPPFEQGHDIDHVRHAYELLASGGRLVSVLSEGPFFRADRKSAAFRDWLDELRASVEQLPDDAFQGMQVFRETAVRTRLVTITKLAEG